MNPRVSIIILNWNGIVDTLECLDSLKNIEYNNFDVYIVDNNSSDNSQELIRKWIVKNPEKKYFQINNKENFGFAKGNNVAIKKIIKQSSSDYILLLNNDTVVKKDFLNKLINIFIEDSSVAITGSKNYYFSNKKEVWFNGGNFKYYLGGLVDHNVSKKIDNPIEVDYVCGSSLLFSIDKMKNIFLNEKYFCYYEDMEFCYKARQKGYKVIFQPKSIIYHKVGKTISQTKNYVYFNTRNRIWFVRNNLNTFKKIVFNLSFYTIRFPFLFIKYLRSGQIEFFFKGIFDAYFK